MVTIRISRPLPERTILISSTEISKGSIHRPPLIRHRLESTLSPKHVVRHTELQLLLWSYSIFRLGRVVNSFEFKQTV